MCAAVVRGSLLLTRHLLLQRSVEAAVHLLVGAFLDTLATSRGHPSYISGDGVVRRVKALCIEIVKDRKKSSQNDGGLSSRKRAAYFTALSEATGIVFRDMASAQALGAVFEICVG